MTTDLRHQCVAGIAERFAGSAFLHWYAYGVDTYYNTRGAAMGQIEMTHPIPKPPEIVPIYPGARMNPLARVWLRR